MTGEIDKLALTLFQRHGVRFHDSRLLGLALRHASRDASENNERLEFLGDRVLGLVLAATLYETYPDETEGAMALRHAALVRADIVAQMGRALCISEAVDVSDHDRSAGTAALDNVVADATEALIGALYLDQGLGPCARLIKELWADAIASMSEPPQDPKTALQEWAQGRGLPLPHYDLVAREGPDHAPFFTISVTVKGYAPATASGPSRRLAEKAAASDLLTTLRQQARK